jgi:hypothetical protein
MAAHTRRLRATYLHLVRNPVADDGADTASVEVAKPKVLVDALGVPVADISAPAYAWTKKLRGKIWEEHDGDLAEANAVASAGGSPFSGAGFQLGWPTLLRTRSPLTARTSPGPARAIRRAGSDGTGRPARCVAAAAAAAVLPARLVGGRQCSAAPLYVASALLPRLPARSQTRRPGG